MKCKSDVVAVGSFVLMKRLKTPSGDLDIAVWFSTEPQRSDSANYCVPIPQVLTDPNAVKGAIIVMPLLRKFDEPRFDTIGEAVAFFKQIFEPKIANATSAGKCIALSIR
ncbi:hypothetical protein DFH08DRAFT_805091 [Mycena albidolilacea]|uniref:Uncharacterized protein n=1 Tax=Mycena albidolilacea TaxID=1033008 RepID=A0AAD7AAQ1_9AGAR|nr:hypothetical protein DFH08DRAFT_805091 [Mycena albidolilacea]